MYAYLIPKNNNALQNVSTVNKIYIPICVSSHRNVTFAISIQTFHFKDGKPAPDREKQQNEFIFRSWL